MRAIKGHLDALVRLCSGMYANFRQNANYYYFNVLKFQICQQSILVVIQAVHTVCIVLYIGYSGPVIGSSLFAVFRRRKRTVCMCRGLSLLYMSQHMCFGVLVTFFKPQRHTQACAD